MEDPLYDIARKVTDEVLGEGTYAEINRGNPDPGVQAAIAKAEEEKPLARIVTEQAHETYPTFEGSTVRHGTASGWTLHQKLKERPCDPCFQAKSEYDKRRLEAPERLQRNRLRARAQQRAESALVKRYKEEYDELYKKFLAEIFSQEGSNNGTPGSGGHEGDRPQD